MLESLLGGQQANGPLLFLLTLLWFAAFVWVLDRVVRSVRVTYGLVQLLRDSRKAGKLQPLALSELEPCPSCLGLKTNNNYSPPECATCRGRGVLLRSRN